MGRCRVIDSSLRAAVAPPATGARRCTAMLACAGLALPLVTMAAETAADLPSSASLAPTVQSARSVASAVVEVPAAAGSPSASPSRWSTSSEFSAGDYRWSLSRGPLDFGLRFETPSRPALVAESRLDAAGPYVQTLPALSLGLRSFGPPPPASSLLERAWAPSVASPAGGSVGIEWKPEQQQLMFLREGLGVRLSGDDRLTMRLRKGTLGLYMKRVF